MPTPAINIESLKTFRGYRYAVVIQPPLQFRCGYVELPKNHVLEGVYYYEDSSVLNDMSPEECFEVHGRLTYSHTFEEIFKTQNWVFGFDAGHHNDGWTSENGNYSNEGPVRTLGYMEGHCWNLINQIIEKCDRPKYVMKTKVRFKL